MGKKEVKPFIDIDVKDTIYKLCFISGYSVNGMCEDFCNNAFRKGLAQELSPYFKWGLQIDGAVFKGDKKAKRFVSSSDNLERISLKIDGKIHSYAYNLAYAMETSVAKIIAYGIEKSMNDYDFLDRYIKQFLRNKIDKERKDMILKLVRTINKDYTVDEELGMISLLLYIADEYKRLDEGIDGVLKDSFVEVK